MLGAMVGDIVGSIYEWNNIKTKSFPLFAKGCCFTDDTVMTMAVAEALMQGGAPEDYIEAMKRLGRQYPRAGYGGRFRQWIQSEESEPYNSWGNGSAMRVSPCGWNIPLHLTREEGVKVAERLAENSAVVTHNHPEGVKGAQAVAVSILYMRHGKSDNSIEEYKEYLRRDIAAWYGYDMGRTLDEIRPTYSFDVSCQGSVPEAIIAFLESNSFENAIRNAISIGGDSDTIAAITGSIAEAAYSIPDDVATKAMEHLDDNLREIYQKWRLFVLSPS